MKDINVPTRVQNAEEESKEQSAGSERVSQSPNLSFVSSSPASIVVSQRQYSVTISTSSHDRVSIVQLSLGHGLLLDVLEHILCSKTSIIILGNPGLQISQLWQLRRRRAHWFLYTLLVFVYDACPAWRSISTSLISAIAESPEPTSTLLLGKTRFRTRKAHCAVWPINRRYIFIRDITVGTVRVIGIE